MIVRLCLATVLCLMGAHALAAQPAAGIPSTPAGDALASWLDAFNSGDRPRIDSFDSERFPALDIGRAMSLRARTGGFEVLGIEKSAAKLLIFHVREATGRGEDIGLLVLSDADPRLIETLRFFPIPPGAKYEDVTLDAAARTQLIDAIASTLAESYVFPEVGKQMGEALRSKNRHGAYKEVIDGEVFAIRLSNDLRDVSHDPHVELRFSPVAQAPPPPGKQAEPGAGARAPVTALNCGFEKAEHLPPNIGYLKFNMFADPAICGPTATAALNFVADSDSLILDLRDNNGGDGAMAMFVASYLFAEPTHLNDSYDRRSNTTTQSWTLASVPGKRFANKPVFVLTSGATFSAAEDFSYALKNLKRATLVGESTGGGAHMVRRHPLDTHFTLVVPFARSVSPITKTNWEGTGVEPDVKVPAGEALAEALKRARS